MKVIVLTILSGILALCAAGSPRFEPSPAKCRLPVELIRTHPAAPGQEFPPPPDDDRGYDVTSYDLDLNLDPVTRTITGQVDIGLKALDPGRMRVRLDLVANMTCDGVLAGDLPLAFTHEGDSLVVELFGVELDKMTANDHLEDYRREFTGPVDSWVGRHQPTDEGTGDPENMSDWRVCYDVERA